jgi:predicted nucleotide-binding protein
MATKQKIVTKLSRYELWAIVDEYELLIEDRRRLDHLQDAVRLLPKKELRDILLSFGRVRLKEICRALEIDDSGKRISEIVDRLIVDTDNDGIDTASKIATTKEVHPLDVLTRAELLFAIDQNGISVEDRRVRESVQAKAATLTNAQLGAVLEDLSRDRLKEICRALGYDDSGKRKDELVGRILEDLSNDSGAGSDRKKKLPRAKLGLPRLFIGSTSEALHVAREVQAELHREFQVTIWNQNMFSAGEMTWSQLVAKARNGFDFALLVFSADDLLESRGKSTLAPRDNVLLEYGLFVGALGSDRTFFLYNHDHPPKIASDLAGVTALTYGDRNDDNLQAAVGPACTGLRRRYAQDGRRAK